MILERVVKRVLVHDAAARGVQQIRVRFHQRQLPSSDEAARLFSERTMNGNEVGLPEQFFHAHQARTGLRRHLPGDKRIKREGLFHAKAAQQLDRFARDAAKANHAERAVAQFAAIYFERSSHCPVRARLSLMRKL